MSVHQRATWWGFAVTTGCLPFVMLGCGRPDLKGYRPAHEHAVATRDQEASPADPAVSHEQGATVREIPGVAVNTTDNPIVESAVSDSDFLPVSALVPVNVVDGANVRALMSIPVSDPRTADANPVAVVPASSSDALVESAGPRRIELLVKDRSFRTDAKTSALRVSFDDLDLLKVLNMDPVVDQAVELMPEWLRGLNGKVIRLRGFMYPTYDTEGIEHFVLARDNQICCFGREPKVYDLVQVDMKQGKTTTYIPATRAFDVVGRFKIDLQTQDGKPYGLYVIEQAEVIDR